MTEAEKVEREKAEREVRAVLGMDGCILPLVQGTDPIRWGWWIGRASINKGSGNFLRWKELFVANAPTLEEAMRRFREWRAT